MIWIGIGMYIYLVLETIQIYASFVVVEMILSSNIQLAIFLSLYK